MKPDLILTPTDFVAITNQSLETVFGHVFIEGELANFKISKNHWIYFDIKDEFSKVSCFGSVYNLPGPLKDGMLVKISGQPRLHPQFGFKVNIQSIQPSGEGSIKKAYDLLKLKLQKEGLFDEARKRYLPYPPIKVALVTSVESAAYADFIKIINNRWPFLDIIVFNTQVQGESAPTQLINSIDLANKSAKLDDVIVIIRGGGSADDLAAFDDERVVRAIASSRIPTLVAIGHEIDTSLSELVADKRASTPSNAAELLVPDKKAELSNLNQKKGLLRQYLNSVINNDLAKLDITRSSLKNQIKNTLEDYWNSLLTAKQLLKAYNPELNLKKGYSITKHQGKLLVDVSKIKIGNKVITQIFDGSFESSVTKIIKQ